MVDAIVATGAAIVDIEIFEALGFQHYQGTPLLTINTRIKFISTDL